MTSFDPSKINTESGNWELFEQTPDYRRYRMWLDDKRYIVRTEFLGEDTLLEENKALRNETDGQKWGNTPLVASIPLNLFFSPQTQLAEKMVQGDRDHMKWWLNRSENQHWRTKRGTV